MKKIVDPTAPTKQKYKLPSGKVVTLKKKKPNTTAGVDETEIREQFLALIREGITDKDAAKACGCGTKYFQRRRANDPAFEEAYKEARQDGNDVIRAEIRRRGVDGVKRAIYHDGKVVGHKQEYSDPLLMFLAKSRMPDEFGDKTTHEHTHKFDGAAETLVTKLAGMLGLPDPKQPEMIDVTPNEAD